MKMQQALEATRNTLRFLHYAQQTEKTYLHWLERYGRWIASHPTGTHEDKIAGYLTHLAKDRRVSQITQKQALNAIVFLYDALLNQSLERMIWREPTCRDRFIRAPIRQATVRPRCAPIRRSGARSPAARPRR